MDAASLHERFLADLAEARTKDREETGRIFLTVNVPVGRFWLAPLTLERYLFLEQVKSPFLGFCTEEEMIPTKEDVLQFLWIMNPNFRPSQRAGRWFAYRNYFIRWRSYALKIYKLIAAELEAELEKPKDTSEEMGTTWIAALIDGAASQYGWSERDILNLPIQRAKKYMDAMVKRVGGGKSIEFNRHADKARHEYLGALNKLNKELEKKKETDGKI